MTDEVGRNIWDEEWEVGGIDSSSGMPVIQRNAIRTSNFIPVNPFGEYCVSISRGLYIFVYLYDKSGTFIFNAGRKDNGDIISIPNNAYLLKFETSSVYGETYINDICINKSDSQNGTYTPSRGLRKQIIEVSNEALDIKMLGWSVPKECPIHNYMDLNRKFHQKVGRVDLGTLNWEYASSPAAGSAFFFTSHLDMKYNPAEQGIVYCYKYRYDINGISIWQEGKDKVINTKRPYTANEINVVDSSYTDATAFKSAINGVYLYYELANEILINVDGREISNTITDLKMLGWSVPEECPIHNYIDNNRRFHQRVGRIDLGTLNWGYAYDAGYQYYPFSDIPNLKTTTLYLNGYTFVSDTAGWALMPNMSIKKHPSNTTNWRIRDDRYTTVSEFKTAMQDAYLYYELADEIVSNIDGNEAILLTGDLSFITGDVNWDGIPEIFTIEKYSMYVVFASSSTQSAIYIVNGVGETQAAVVKLAGDDLVSFSFNGFTVTANVNQYCAYAIYRLATNKT